jgi:thiol-disulfide isomerase/thioredoxin
MTLNLGSVVRFCGVGFLLAGMSLVLNGCGSSDPVTAKNSRFEVAGEAEKEPAKEGATAKSGEEEGFPFSKETPVKSGKNAPKQGSEPEAETPEKAEGPDVAVDDNTKYGASLQYPLPSGGAEQLAKFLQELDSKTPKGDTEKEQKDDYVAIQDSRLAAARKLLTLKIPPQMKSGLLQLMMQIHQEFLQNKIPGAEERLEAFAQELGGNKDPQIAEIGRIQAFDIAINKLAKTDPPPEDGTEVAAAIEKFAKDAGSSQMSWTAAASKCMELKDLRGASKQFRLDMVGGIKKLAELLRKNPDKSISSQADAIVKKAESFDVEIELTTLAKEIEDGKEGAEEKFLETIKQLIEKDKSRQTLQMVSQLGTELEYGLAKYATALKLYEVLEANYKDSKDKDLVEFVTKTTEAARKRIGLVGKPLAVTGVTTDGKPFDFASYKGKYVLVDFWATWCGPCLAELPNVKRNYNAYHSKGFDVIGISLDDDLGQLKDFLKLQGPPWKTVVCQELFDKKTLDEGSGMSANPLAADNGVHAIPFVVLLDKEGKVDSLHLRGPKLAARLKELLGEPAEAAATEEEGKKPEEKPAEEKTEKKEEGKKGAEESADKPAAEKAEPKKEEGGGGCGFVAEEEKKEAADDDSKVNPYSAKPGLPTDKLVAYIEKMLDKPKSIQSRPGFAEAVVEAADRVLTASPAAKEPEVLTAAEAKFETLHKKACTGDEAFDKSLVAFTEQMKSDQRPRIARPVAFFQMERKVLDGAELPADKIPALLKELKDYYAAEKLTTKHLRMASSTVALINKLESGDEREKLFGEFGGLFAKSSDKELARYGKKLAQKPEAEESDLVGKNLELAGTTAEGKDFKWADYRGKVVLVDFWATWCGPCKREMPHVKELHDKLTAKGFSVVGISLDKDQEALSTYLAENQIPWENLAGDETQELAEKYGVRGIPTMMAIGKDGKILGVAHNVASLVPLIEKALAAK